MIFLFNDDPPTTMALGGRKGTLRIFDLEIDWGDNLLVAVSPSGGFLLGGISSFFKLRRIQVPSTTSTILKALSNGRKIG